MENAAPRSVPVYGPKPWFQNLLRYTTSGMPFMAFPNPHSSTSTLLCPREGHTLDCAVFINTVLTHWLWMALVNGTQRIQKNERDGPGAYSLDPFSGDPMGWLPLWTRVGLLTSCLFPIEVPFYILGFSHSLKPWFLPVSK